jgi:ligand-binding SRPBCC domain-containing protein
MAREYLLEQVQLIPATIPEVFPFFTDAHNLERITPPFLNFKIRTPAPIEMRSGTLLDYQIRLYGVPMRWRTVIEDWEPGVRFVDRQLRGPYKLWHHTHEFHATSEGTVMVDRVRYQMPSGPIGALARRLFVEGALEKIFAFRFRTIEQLFKSPPLAVSSSSSLSDVGEIPPTRGTHDHFARD